MNEIETRSGVDRGRTREPAADRVTHERRGRGGDAIGGGYGPTPSGYGSDRDGRDADRWEPDATRDGRDADRDGRGRVRWEPDADHGERGSDSGCPAEGWP